MNKRVLFGLFVILFFFMFSEMWIKENQKIIETFEDGSPKLIHISKTLLGNSYIVRSIEFWEKDKIRYDKQFKNGRPEGKQIFISESGEKTEQWIKNGKRNGKYLQWNAEGDLTLEELWKNGKREKVLFKSKTK